MVSVTKHDTPALRFDGFDGEWETSELDVLVEVGNGRDYKHLNEGRIPVYGTGGYMLSVDQALSYNKDAIGIGRKGTIDKPYLLRAPFWTVDTLFFVMAKSGIDLSFLFSVFQRVDWKSKNTATGVPSLTSQAIEQTAVTIAPALEEQRAIGELFADLDALIEQHRAKHANLQQTKTALMQRMFPQDGADEPELRLGGFSGAWKSQTLSELTSINNGLDYKHLNEGDIPVYGTGGYMLSVDRALSYKTDAIGIGRKGTIDKPYLLRAPFWTVDTLFYVTARDGANLQFLLTQFQRVDWKSKNTATGVPSLTSVTIGQTSISVPPTLEEQRAIGEVFADLDALIAAEASYITQLTQAKTALLQRMFV